MAARKRGMNVVAFSFVWLTITIGTLFIAFKRSGAELQLPNCSEIGVKVTTEPAIGSLGHRVHEDWKTTPRAMDDESAAFHREQKNPTIEDEKNHGLTKEALVPFESLCILMAEGGEENLRRVLPAEYIDRLLEKYDFVVKLFGGVDEAIKQIMKMKFQSLANEVGTPQAVSYSIDRVTELNGEAFEEMQSKLKATGVDCQVDEAYRVIIELTISGDMGNTTNRYSYELYRTGTNWFLSPNGLNL